MSSGFHETLRGLRALRFHRVPQSSATTPHGFDKAPQCSTKGSRNVLQGSVEGSSVSCARIKIALLMGGTLSKTAHFHCFLTCSLAQANVGFVANQITLLRDSRCSRVDASKNSTRGL